MGEKLLPNVLTYAESSVIIANVSENEQSEFIKDAKQDTISIYSPSFVMQIKNSSVRFATWLSPCHRYGLAPKFTSFHNFFLVPCNGFVMSFFFFATKLYLKANSVVI